MPITTTLGLVQRVNSDIVPNANRLISASIMNDILSGSAYIIDHLSASLVNTINGYTNTSSFNNYTSSLVNKLIIGDIPFYSGSNVFSSSGIFFNNGNIGIRTTNPASTLHIIPISAGDSGIKFDNSINTFSSLIWASNNIGLGLVSGGGLGIKANAAFGLTISTSTSISSLGAMLNIKGAGATSSSYSLKIQNSNSANLFTIQDDGNVGIGIASSSFKLNVITGSSDIAASFTGRVIGSPATQSNELVTLGQLNSASAYTFNNGLTKTGNTVTLGGNLIDTNGTTINCNHQEWFPIYNNSGSGTIINQMYFSPFAKSILISALSSSTLYNYIDVHKDQVELYAVKNNTGSRMIFKDSGCYFSSSHIGTGIQYSANYSASFTSRSLVDKAYVDNFTSSLTFNNGLTKSGNAVKLGGLLTNTTTMISSSTSTQNIILSGSTRSVNGDYSDGFLQIINSGSGVGLGINVSTNGTGIYVTNTDTGIWVDTAINIGGNFSGDAYGILCQSVATGGLFNGNNSGIAAISQTGIGVSATSVSGLAGSFRINSSSINNVANVVDIIRGTTGTAAAGIGAALNLKVENNAGTDITGASLRTVFISASAGAIFSTFEIHNTNSSSLEKHFSINPNGQLNATLYGAGTFTGSAIYALGVDSTGNVIEIVTGSGGGLSGAGISGRVTYWNAGTTITSSGELLYTANNSGTLSIGTSNTQGHLNLGGNKVINSSGQGMYFAATTFTDNVTNANETASAYSINLIASPTLTASNNNVYIPGPSTLYVMAPTKGANVNFSKPQSAIFSDGMVYIQGGLFRTITGEVSGTIMDQTRDVVTLSAGAGTVGVHLPDAVSYVNACYTFKRTDATANSCSIWPSGSQTIDGAARYDLVSQYKYVTIISNGSTWYIIANN